MWQSFGNHWGHNDEPFWVCLKHCTKRRKSKPNCGWVE